MKKRFHWGCYFKLAIFKKEGPKKEIVKESRRENDREKLYRHKHGVYWQLD